MAGKSCVLAVLVIGILLICPLVARAAVVPTVTVVAHNSTMQGDYHCDGVNDQIEIQQALDTASTVILSDGSFSLSGQLNFNKPIDLRGQSESGTILTFSSSIVIRAGDESGGQTGITMKNMTIARTGSALAGTTAIFMRKCNNISITHCTFNKTDVKIQGGIAPDHPETVVTNNVLVQYCTFNDTPRSEGWFALGNSANGWQILDCTFNNIQGSAIDLSQSNNAIVSRCVINGALNPWLSGIYSEGGKGVQFTNNTVRNCPNGAAIGISAGEAGAWTPSKTGYGTFDGNTIESSKVGIMVMGVPGMTVSNNKIQASQHGVWIGTATVLGTTYPATGTWVFGNSISSGSSAVNVEPGCNNCLASNPASTPTRTPTPTPTAPRFIVAIGDSLTDNGEYETHLKSLLDASPGGTWTVTNQGHGGDKTADMLSKFQANVLNANPDYVIIWGGINDVATVPAATIESNLQAMYTAAHNQGIKVISVNISPTTWVSSVLLAVNTWIANTATNVDYRIDAYTLLNNPSNPSHLLPAYDSGDGVHLNTAGHDLVATTIYNSVSWSTLTPIPTPTRSPSATATPIPTPVLTPLPPLDLSGNISASGVVQQTVHYAILGGQGVLDIGNGTTALLGGQPLQSVTVDVVYVGLPPPPAGAYIIGYAYDYGPTGSTLSPPITLTLKYDPVQVPAGVDPSKLAIAYYDATAEMWVALPSAVDTVNHAVTAQIGDFTMFAVYAPNPTVTPTLTVAPTPTPMPPPAGKTNVGLIVGPIIAVIVIGLVTYWLSRRRKPPMPPPQ